MIERTYTGRVYAFATTPSLLSTPFARLARRSLVCAVHLSTTTRTEAAVLPIHMYAIDAAVTHAFAESIVRTRKATRAREENGSAALATPIHASAEPDAMAQWSEESVRTVVSVRLASLVDASGAQRDP